MLGVVFVIIGWIVVSILFLFYVSMFVNYSVIYGSIGGIIVLMIWFYLSGILIILGGEINVFLYKCKKFFDENFYYQCIL